MQVFPHWLGVLSALTDLDIQADIVTNGERLTRDIAFALREHNAYGVSISIDGPPSVHDALRGKSGQFDTVFGAAAWVQEAGLRLGVVTHVNKMNFLHLDALYEILSGWHVDGRQLQLTQPSGAASDSNCLIDRNMLEQLHSWAAEKQEESLFAYNRNGHTLSGACAICVYGKICRGGCAGFAYAVAGSLGAVPLCFCAGSIGSGRE